MSGPGMYGLGDLIYDPNLSANTGSDLARREVRSKVYKQMQPSIMKKTPLTKAMMSHKGKAVTNTKFEWARRREITQFGFVKGCYTSSALATEYDNSGAAVDAAKDAIVYVELPNDIAVDLQPHETFRMYDKTQFIGLSLDVEEIDYSNVAATANHAIVKARLMEDDDSDNGNVLGVSKASSNCVIHPLSMAMPELFQLPDGYTEEAELEYNYTQKFAEAFSMSGDKLSDKNAFTEDNYSESLRQSHTRFMQQLEWAAIWGIRDSRTAPVSVVAHGNTKAGKRLFTGGLVSALKSNVDASGVSNFLRIPQITTYEGTNFSGKTFDAYGWDFFKLLMNHLAKWSGEDKEVYLSTQTYQAITDMFEANATITIDSNHKDAWGFKVTQIRGLNCNLNLHQHALMNVNPAYSKAMLILEPKQIEWVPKAGRDITFINSTGAAAIASRKGNNDGFTWRDGVKEGWMADGGILFNNIEAMAYIDGVGENFHT